MKVNITKKFLLIERYKIIFKMALFVMLLTNISANAQARQEVLQSTEPSIKVQFFSGENAIMIDTYKIDSQDITVKIFDNDDQEVYSKKQYLRKGASIVTSLHRVKNSPKYVVKIITRDGELTSEFSKKK